MSGIKVYYNSACPVCKAGIEVQQRRMAGGVEWIDIHRVPGAAAHVGASCEFVRERLHVVDEDGKVRVGTEAFGVLMRHTPGQETGAHLLALPIVRTVARWCYNVFAAALYRWNRALKRW